MRFADGDRPVQDIAQALLWRAFATDGFVGEVGGRGGVFGASGFQDISVPDVPGVIAFDTSFNRGGDVFRLAGDAQTWLVATVGSNVVLVHGYSSVLIPFGPAGAAIVFDDGMRELRYDTETASVTIGSQVVGESLVPLTAPSMGSPAPGDIDPDAGGRIFVTANGELFAGGKLAIFGTSGREDIHLTYGDVVLDPSFNRGGDTISLALPTLAFTAREVGSNIILHSETLDVTIPYGPAGTTIAFNDASRVLRYDVELEAVLLGDQILGTEPVPGIAGVI